MAYKRNPMRAERIGALSRFVISLQQNGAQTAASQWLERTLDDSANRRLVLPEAFLAVDAILILAENIAAGLEVREEVVARHVREQMPFMATERWLMLGVEAGGDRQALHEVVRKHSMAAAERMAKGESNDLIDRLSIDAAFKKLDAKKLPAELDPARYVGRSPEQVDDFLKEYLRPLVRLATPLATTAGASEIRV
jgi:adenylosuccinate lyase